MLPVAPQIERTHFAPLWITARGAAERVLQRLQWARGDRGTHRAISPTRQDPQVVDLAVQLQPAGNREGQERRADTETAARERCHCRVPVLTEP